MPRELDQIDRYFKTLLANAEDDLSQRRIAARIGMRPSALCRALSGKRRLRWEEAEALARYLPATASDLMTANANACAREKRPTPKAKRR